MYMTAARMYGKDDLRVERVPVPDIGEDEILLKVKAASICGTDLRMLKNGAVNVSESSPLILSHEFSGTIEKTGSLVSGCKPGDRVSVAPNIGCGKCFHCVSGNGHHCKELTALGVHMDGGFAEYARIPSSAVRLGNVTLLADTLSFGAAAANEAFSCVYNAFERYRVRAGDVVLVIGAGAIGLMHVKLAKMAGAAKIMLNDLSAERLRYCAGIEPSIITVEDALERRISEETGGKGADVVVTACSAAAAQRAALSLAGLDGRVNFFGGLPKGKENVELDTNLIHYKQLSVTGTTRASLRHYRETLELTASGLIDLDCLITHEFPLADIRKGFDNAANAIGLKQLIVF